MKLQLPELPFNYNALEPHLDAETMELHYDKHHRGYLTKLLAVLENYPELLEYEAEDILKELNDLEVSDEDKIKIKNLCGGFLNHVIYWNNINPDNSIDEELVSDIERDFGSVEEMKAKFSDLAKKHFGSGWTWLVRNSGGELEIYSLPNQDSPYTLSHEPILTLDVWEHAYYLKYRNKRDEFVDAWWNVVKII